CLRAGQPEHPLLGHPGGTGGAAVWHRGRPGQERNARRAEVDEEPARVPVGAEQSHPVRVHAQAQFVAQSNRNRVWGDYAKGRPSRQFPVGGRPPREVVGVYRLLQPSVRQAIQVDLYRTPTPDLTRWSNWQPGATGSICCPRGCPFTPPGSSASTAVTLA